MSLKKLTLITVLMFSLLSAETMTPFSKVATGEPILVQEGRAKMWCPVCGMNLKMFYKTSHTSTQENKKKKQYCSLRCLIVDRHNNHFDKRGIQVVDAKSEKLIDANKAFYVLGSVIKGTMSKVSKLAFGSKNDATAFVKEYGGEIVDFDTVLQKAEASLESDIAMINMKKQKKMYPMGKKLIEKKCQQSINPMEYQEINQLKSAIVNDKLCTPLKEKQLQAVALYLWEVERTEDLNSSIIKIEITEDEKCPVCGMFAYKYPKWVAQIFYKEGEHEPHYSFDGVKDLMKFYFDPMKWGKYEGFHREDISKILVTDYYSQKAIDGKEAYFVIGSDVTGPMGNELIPFEKKSDAKIFYKDHKGKSIVRFDKIVKKEVYKLDE